MARAVMGKQLMITVNNEVGTLAEITDVVSSLGINMIAISAYAIDNKGLIIFVCEDPERAKKELAAKKFNVREEDVILLTVENKPGTLKEATGRIADAGIDLNLLYGSVSKNQKDSCIVLVSEDNQGVLRILNVN